jgi:hypothetical protein
MQQKELDSYDKKMELEERRVAAAEDQVNQRRLEFENAVGLQAAQKYAKDLYSRIYSIDEAVTSGELDEVGALEAAANSFSEYASTLPEEYAAPIREKLQDGLTIDEYRQIKAVNAGALDDYGLLDEENNYETLSPEEEAALGMDQDWSENTIVQRDSEGKLSRIDRPTGLSAEDLAARGSAMTGAQEGGLARDFRQNAQGAAEAANMGATLLMNAGNNPTSLGVPGSMVRWAGNLVTGMRTLADYAGYEYAAGTTKEDLLMQQEGYTADWDWSKVNWKGLGIDEAGAAAERFRAGVYGIAFASAVAVQGTRPTDKDIQQFIDQIGGTATNPKGFMDTIYQFMDQLDYRLDTIATSSGIKYKKDLQGNYTDEFTVDYGDSITNTWKPAFKNFLNTYGEQSGKMDNGEFLVNDQGHIAIYDRALDRWKVYD